MPNISETLFQFDYQLPTVSAPGGNYVSVNVRGNIAYVAIQFPILDEVYHYQGILGQELSTEDGYKAFEMCALNVIAQIDNKIGFDRVMGL
ncbi:MAG: RidA family protein, partial [Bacteroidota bacterium]|nr:RidA family protein [Bacteroidota bacterium]MDX5429741.1 RidA family protein [Bacteroidota bacterium]MDX5468520.1 RidA family protein [Bacteroidota bacterium]